MNRYLRNTYTLLIMLLCMGTASAQNIANAEYFWDNDPGAGNGTALTALDGSFDGLIETALGNAVGLPAGTGTHTLSVRVQDNNNNWGPVFSVVVDINAAASTVRNVTVSSGEYFWDTDPGVGNGTVLIAFDGAFDESIESLLQNITPPSVGVHTLSFRIKDIENVWGTTFSVVVDVNSAASTIRDISVSAGEYFWDADPGVGNGTPMIALDGAFDESIEGILQNTSVPTAIGVHTLNVRVKDIENVWGPTFSVIVDINSAVSTIRDIQVSSGEYFWDTDPGVGSGTPLIAQDGAFDDAIEAMLQNATLPSPVGVHKLSVRVKDIENVWGPVFSVVVDIENPVSTIRDITVSSAEYFWDTDPGLGNGIPMIAFDGSYNDAIEGLLQNAALPSPVGLHTLNIRAKDIENVWGPVFKVVVDVENPVSTIRDVKVTAAEYFFNNDPGQGNATPMIALDGNFNESVEQILGGAIPIPVNAGLNVLNLRVRDVENTWGPLFSVVVNVDTTIFPCDSITSSFIASTDFAYDGYTVNFTNTAHNGINYEWQVNGQSYSTAADTSYTFDSAGVYTFALISENTGCYDTAFQTIPVGGAQFQKTYGNSSTDYEGLSTITADGGYLLAQQNNFPGGNSLSMVINKLDVFGNLQWTKTLDSAQIDKPTAVIEATDGSFYIAGYTTTSVPDVDAIVVKLNSNGTIIWQQRIGSASDEYTFGLTEATNGDIAITGRVDDNVVSTFGDFDIFLTRINSSGTVVWSQIYGGTGTDFSTSVFATNDGGFIVGGITQPGAVALRYPYFIKTNSAGDIDWSLTVPGSSNNDIISSIIQTADGGYLATGTTFSFGPGAGDVPLFKITSGGALDWVKGYGTPAGLEIGKSVLETDDGYIVGGYVDVGAFGEEDLLLLKTDLSGNLLWSKIYGGSTEDRGYSVSEALDGGFALSGHTNSFNPSFEAYLVRTDSAGNSGCQEQNITLNTGGTSPFTGTLNSSDTLAMVATNANLVQLSNPISVAEPCNPSSCSGVFTTLDTTVCFGETVQGYNATGVYKDTIALGNGCDSIHTLTLTVRTANTTNITTSICAGESLYGYTTGGTFVDSYTDVNGCDSTRTLNLSITPLTTFTENRSICQGQSYHGYTSAGQYIDTFVTAGCDSIRTLNLTVQSSIVTNVSQTICFGTTFEGYGSTGTFRDTFATAGCDSIRILNLTVRAQNTTTITDVICPGENSQGYTTTGTFVDVFTDANGCDSTRTLNLTALSNTRVTIDTTICFGETFEGYSVTGTHRDTFQAANTCDSVRIINLTVRAENRVTLTRTICQGDMLYGYTATGVYTDTYTGFNGCDSVRVLDLTVSPTIRTNLVIGICQGQNYQGYTTTGVYIDTFATAGCDSIRTVDLSVTNNIQITIDSTICYGDNYQGYNTTGTYVDQYVATGGCDSIRTLNLTVLALDTGTVVATGCQGESVQGYTSTGTYTDVFTNANGCDSTRTLVLTILPTSATLIDTTICFGETFEGYAATGTYMDTFTAANTCDSIRIINLTVRAENSVVIDSTICAGDTVYGYTSSGNYADVYTGANGCDSTRTLNLTVLPSATFTETISICTGQSYQGYTTTGVYNDTFQLANGCDSIRTLDLTVSGSITTTIDTIICEGESFAGYDTTGTYVDTFTATAGCDSIRTINLTVEIPLKLIIDAFICDGDSIFAGGAYQTTGGTYYDTLSSTNGCDSMIVLTGVQLYLAPTKPVITRTGTILSVPDVYDTYQWFQDGALIVGATTDAISITTDGTYEVAVTDSNNCGSESDSIVVINVGIGDLSSDYEVKVYPNPTERMIFIETTLPRADVYVYNAIGELTTTTQITGDQLTSIDAELWPAGIYFVKLIAPDGEQLTVKVFKD